MGAFLIITEKLHCQSGHNYIEQTGAAIYNALKPALPGNFHKSICQSAPEYRFSTGK